MCQVLNKLFPPVLVVAADAVVVVVVLVVFVVVDDAHLPTWLHCSSHNHLCPAQKLSGNP